jgi:hypothetical protein
MDQSDLLIVNGRLVTWDRPNEIIEMGRCW